MSEAYFCLVTWPQPDGREGLLFPRPGNVAINKTLEDGTKDFEIACQHLREHIEKNPGFKGTVVRLVRFERHEVVKEFPEPLVEKIPPPVAGNLARPHECSRCGRQMSHTQKWGYICEYCAGIED